MRRLLLVLPLVVLVAAGCVRPRPNTRVQPTSLEVPPPPPRLIVPPEPEEPPDEKVAEEPEAKDRRPTRPRPQPARERAETAKPADAKQEPPPEARPPATAPVPPGQLQPQLSVKPDVMRRQVSDQLSQAKKELDRIDYRALGADAKAQYETAKRFIDQAWQALNDQNLLFAAKLAEKALGLASNLVTR